jgi:hypothetical protein
MAVYQIMTEFLGLPEVNSCGLVKNDHMSNYLSQLQQN